jgi:ABC-2 type transport system permease protein
MLNLYLSDLYKIRKSAAMKVLFAIASVSAIAVAVMAFFMARGTLSKNLSGINFLLSDISMMSLLGAVAAGVFVCGDFDNRSIHEAIANGNSRAAVVVSKAASFGTAVLFILLPYVIVTAASIGTGSPFNMGVSMGFMNLLTTEAGKSLSAADIGKLIFCIVSLVAVYLGQLSVCVLFAMVFKKPVVVVAVNYGLSILVGQLQSIKNASRVFYHIFAVTPFGGSYDLINLGTSCGDLAKAIGVSAAFSAVMLLITFFAVRKSEIK